MFYINQVSVTSDIAYALFPLIIYLILQINSKNSLLKNLNLFFPLILASSSVIVYLHGSIFFLAFLFLLFFKKINKVSISAIIIGITASFLTNLPNILRLNQNKENSHRTGENIVFQFEDLFFTYDRYDGFVSNYILFFTYNFVFFS